jgi:asparagine synthase (glutamine-hydrolysing)
MCGLVGIWRHDGGEADRKLIDLMLTPIAHRGPDGKGIWQHGRVALGHRRLSIIDLTEASGQPMLTRDGMGVLVYNGEVYNYRELRNELEREGITFRTSGDSEVVLESVYHWGVERSVQRFNGMFAFAFWDRRVGVLWLARDRMGIKPLLTADTGSEFLFASEAKALLAHPNTRRIADRYAIANWLLRGGGGSRRMLFVGLDSVEPGSIWKITEHGTEKRSFFHALNAIDVDRLVEASSKKPRSFVGPFRDLLTKSVRLHLAADVKLACACSGGVDSSLIIAFAKKQMAEINGYVADVKGPTGEGEQAERAGHHIGVRVDRVHVDRARFLELWPYAIWHSDTPSTHPSDMALLALAQRCRAEGVKVLLTGEGSDELFGGYYWFKRTYRDWSKSKSWRSWTRFFVDDSPRGDSHLRAPFPGISAHKDRNLRERMIVALDADDECLPQRLFTLLAPVKPDGDRAFLAHCLSSLYHYLSWLLHRHDRMGMAASIEMRVPFIENEILDFAFHLPRSAKLQNGIGKWIVKQVASEVLPPDIVYATKKGFPTPKNFLHGTENLLFGGVLAELMQWPANVVTEIVSLLGGNSQLCFHVVGLELWARIFFRGESPGALSNQLLSLAKLPLTSLQREAKLS